MKLKTIKIKKIESYLYLLSGLLSILIFIWFYSFLKTNVINSIANPKVDLDSTTVRVIDVNKNRFDDVLLNIKNKKKSPQVNQKDIFE